ncbi:MAG: hypothetical protein SNJ50_20700 [Cyanobacteriota bacterium]
MPRPRKWRGETTAIRVPSHLADRLLEIARTLDEIESDDSAGFVQNYPATLFTLEDPAESQRYLLEAGHIEASTAALLDAQVEALLQKCRQTSTNPLAVLAELVPYICKPID